MNDQVRVFQKLCLAYLVLCSSCTQAPRLRPYDERTNDEFERAPLVIVGLAEGDERLGQPVSSPSSSLSQLHRVTVHVENVLKGVAPRSTIQVYYFTFANLNVDFRILVFHKEPVRRVLWLREEDGVYRMACDRNNCTVWIESGAHPGYKPAVGEPIDEAIIDLTMTRGQGPVNNHRFAEEIGYQLGRGGFDAYTVERLGKLALSDSSEVRSQACRWLWMYGHDETAAGLREKANNSLALAGCKCQEGRGGVVCE